MVIDVIAAGRIDPRGMVTGRAGYDDFPRAFDALKTPEKDVKVLLESGA